MNISSEAVEAAARRVYLDSVRGRKTCDAWEALADGEQSFYRFDAKRVLEAAVPHLLAQGYADAFDEGLAAGRGERPATNPYRSQ